jgi:UDP-N-acetylglucosamine--N-acetylmuramyl-(pentapeptide) pyrophosphoryl-undecaprenol N-acetylglucosamine transferase
MRIIVSGGGTGGHVYPVLTVLGALRQMIESRGHELHVLYVGGAGAIEAELSGSAGIPFEAISVGGLRGLSLGTVFRNGAKLSRGVVQSLNIVRRFRPSVLFATGGYVCAPVVAAAWVLRCPTMLYLPDIRPGLAVKALSRLVNRVAVSFEVSRSYLPAAKVLVTGYPVRESLRSGVMSVARKNLGLPEDAFVLLALGGSRGAHSINVATAQIVPGLVASCEIMHVSGKDDLKWLMGLKKELPARQRSSYRVYEYLHEEMADALVAADLAIARAGAATMGEFPAAGLPAILVPYPYSGRHQEPNADHMVENGAALKLDNERLHEDLQPTVLELLGDRRRLAEMADCSRSLFVPDAAERAAGEIARLASRSRWA